ncbi:MAG: hypothetical protein P1V97_39130, partial [Planctomycetota bacterium]|nr:hypothetical protein [Planctomycetota bacterium]
MKSFFFGSLLALICVSPAFAQGVAEPSVDGKSLSAWRGQLKSSTKESRKKAVQAIGKLGVKGAPALPELFVLFDKILERAEVGRTLEKIGEPAIPGLIKALNGNKGLTASAAAPLLGRIGAGASQEAGDTVARALLSVLKKGDRYLGMSAEMGLQGLKEKGLKAYVEVLKDKKADAKLSAMCMKLIEGMGTKGSAAVPIVFSKLQAAKSPREKRQYLTVLEKICADLSEEQCKLMVPVVVSYVEGSEFSLKFGGLRVLGSLGKHVLSV